MTYAVESKLPRRSTTHRAGVAGVIGAVIAATALCCWLWLGGQAPAPFRASFEESAALDQWQVDADSSCVLALSTVRTRDGAQSLKIDAPEEKRCEVVPRIFPPHLDSLLREPFAQARLYRFSTLVEAVDGARAPTNLGDNTIVAQWHSSPDPFFPQESGRGPPLAIRIYDGRWGVTYGWDEDFVSNEQAIADNWHWAGDMVPGRWTDWEVSVRWSHDLDGITEVWRDGALVLRRSGPNTYNDLRGVYLKLGLYHPTSDTTLYLDRVEVLNKADGPY